MLIGLATPSIADPRLDTRCLGSAAIAWSSKKQPIVALSSTEAEYRGAAVATCEAIWLKRLLKDLQEEVSDPTTIYCDNLRSIQLGPSTSRCTIILSESVSFQVKSNYSTLS